jgi:hypothetical protein
VKRHGKNHQRPAGAHKKQATGRNWDAIAESWPDLNVEVDYTSTAPHKLSKAERIRRHGGGEAA